MLVSLNTLLHDALKHQYAIPAFNINFMEQAMAVFDAAEAVNSPIIIQFSSGGLEYMPSWFVKAVFAKAKESHLPVVIHRDHCHNFQEFEAAINIGFQSIMMDGSLSANGTPQSFEDNVAFTKKAVNLKPHHIAIEGELGCLGSLETGLSGEEDGFQANTLLKHSQLLTDPIQAKKFVKQTGIDALAIAIGTSHGAYKFTSPPSNKILDIARVQSISKQIPKIPLVLHGSSSIPQELCKIINQHGGDIPKTFGVPVVAIREAIQNGVCKVNIDSDLRLATTAAVRQSLQNSELFDPRKYLGPAYLLMKSICMERYQAFGSAKQATRLMNHETTTT